MKPLASALARVDPGEAWRPWTPGAGDAWGLKWAGHLYRRAAFGANADELREAVRRGPAATIDRLLSGGPGLADFDDDLAHSARGLGRDSSTSTFLEYQAVWLYRMAHSPHPLRERMTLFWHKHFATSIDKVRQPALMQRQNDLFRRHALGRFGPLVLDVSRDAAMQLWLDSNSNLKDHPNENYGRELMELFTLGVGNYTERDVREAARAFTGWHTAGGEFLFNEFQHDFGPKTVLGRTGNWDGGDVVRILLEQPAAGRFLARKLYRLLISENEPPPDALVEPLAVELRRSDYDVGRVVATILRSRLFFSEHAYRQRVKSPAEYVVGLVHALEATVAAPEMAAAMEGMGQTLYGPPTVKGWEGGRAWLNTATLLARHNLAWVLVGGEDGRFRTVDLPALATAHAGDDAGRQLDFLLDLFLQGDVSAGARKKLLAFLGDGRPRGPERDRRLRETAHTIHVMPEYQLA